MKKIKEEYCLVETYEATVAEALPELVKYMLERLGISKEYELWVQKGKRI